MCARDIATSATRAAESSTAAPLRVAGLFAGIGGIELGLQAAELRSELLCEIDPLAQKVLRAHFPGVQLNNDVRDLSSINGADVVTAGFPCQDLSQAGPTHGIGGTRSGLVDHVFKLLEDTDPKWVVLENVPFMLQLQTGGAMRHLTAELDRLEFHWAYRVVDARAFGVPQRRRRVLVVASRQEDPRRVLFADEAGDPGEPSANGRACGFYWTEGTRGLGWAIDAVPTLKGGSTIGIASPPAVWMPGGAIGMPDVRDGERLQGFDADWTAVDDARIGQRWKLVGNAVCVPVAEWLGRRLSNPEDPAALKEHPLGERDRWPSAAYGNGSHRRAIDISEWPVAKPRKHLAEFLSQPLIPLSERAAEGFLGRADHSSLRFPEGLLDAVRAHSEAVRRQAAA